MFVRYSIAELLMAFEVSAHILYSEYTIGECMALRGKPNEPSVQQLVYIVMQCVDS